MPALQPSPDAVRATPPPVLGAALVWLMLSPGLASAQATDASVDSQDPQEKGYALAARVDRSDAGFGSTRVSATMVLRNAAGQETSRQLTFRTLERGSEDVGDKSLVIFETPRDVAGTALLSHARILDPDDQWLYLPALKRVKRISSANKSGPFVGSEFAFEDFTSTELNKYSYRYVGEDEVDGLKVDVVECTPRYENSGYTRLRCYYDQEVYQTRKLEFYDRKNSLLKTLELTDYREYQGVWRAHRLHMVNHQTNKETDIMYEDYDFGVDYDDGDFVRGVLTRIR
ncbi:MAG: outer membrane lipoprotein-sorting protein [Pseudomonadota bacterium]